MEVQSWEIMKVASRVDKVADPKEDAEDAEEVLFGGTEK